MTSYLAAAAATDTASWLTARTAQVLIVQGADDVAAPPENGALSQREIGDRARLVNLAGVGHSVPIEDPDGVAEVVLEFLSRTAR